MFTDHSRDLLRGLADYHAAYHLTRRRPTLTLSSSTLITEANRVTRELASLREHPLRRPMERKPQRPSTSTRSPTTTIRFSARMHSLRNRRLRPSSNSAAKPSSSLSPKLEMSAHNSLMLLLPMGTTHLLAEPLTALECSHTLYLATQLVLSSTHIKVRTRCTTLTSVPILRP